MELYVPCNGTHPWTTEFGYEFVGHNDNTEYKTKQVIAVMATYIPSDILTGIIYFCHQ